jgi:predicted DNA-binding antitoxin AbrB/MazE fold protein
MTQIINAIYEEGVLKPLQPLDIQEHAEVRIIIEPKISKSYNSYHNIVAEIRRRQLDRGYKSPTRENVDSYLQDERNSWER